METQWNLTIQILNESAERRQNKMGSLLVDVQRWRLRGVVVIWMRLLYLLFILHIYIFDQRVQLVSSKLLPELK